MKHKKPPTLRSEIASLRRAMLHQVKATRGLTDAQQINTRKLNALLKQESQDPRHQFGQDTSYNWYQSCQCRLCKAHTD